MLLRDQPGQAVRDLFRDWAPDQQLSGGRGVSTEEEAVVDAHASGAAGGLLCPMFYVGPHRGSLLGSLQLLGNRRA